MVTSPAYVRDSRMDIVAANTLGRALHAPVFRYAQATGTAPNTARFAFLDPAGRDFYPDWEQVSRDCVAALHAAAGHNPYDKALTAANVPHEGYIYPNCGHGFNCDATPERYNKAAADLAWQRTVDWFNKYART